jgi:hypothetical protein
MGPVSMKSRFLGIALLACALWPLAGCGVHDGGPWQGRVIDAETKQPIEGAAVVAVWEKVMSLPPAGAMPSYLDAEEVLTDKDGVFHVSRKRFLSIFMLRGIRGPYLTIFKPAYGSFPRYQVSPDLTPEHLFEGTGALVELPRLKTVEERAKKFPGLPSVQARPGKFKKYIRLLNQEAREIGIQSAYDER